MANRNGWKRWVLAVGVLVSTAILAQAAKTGRSGSREETVAYEEAPPYIAVGAKLGTLGPGLEATVGLTGILNARVGGNYFAFNYDGTRSDVDYETKLRWASLGLLLDCHPFENNFRVTGGAYYNRNRFDLEGTPNDTVTIGDNEYPAALLGNLSGTMEFRKWAPYLGLGFGNAVKPGATWTFSFDVGILFQGSPDVDLEADGIIALSPQFQADLAQEEEDIQDDVDVFRFYPVLAFGIAYLF